MMCHASLLRREVVARLLVILVVS